jgi:serine phosphatase RsbU (regulator of sigma subunit)/pSer/pThr/pTyr-binding forkhead associated (FHA) protein
MSVQATIATASAASASGRLLLRIADRAGHPSFVPLDGHRLLIGRNRDVNVALEGDKVSRQHAELVKDPFERWWVRDLGSRNGTRVNGVKVAEAVVQPGDVVEIGDFALSLCPAVPPLEESTIGSSTSSKNKNRLAMDEGSPDQIRSLRQLGAPKIGAVHLLAVTEFGHRLNVTQDAGERSRALCDLMLSGEFHGKSVSVLRAPRNAPERAEVIWGPTSAAGNTEVPPPLSRGVLRAVCNVPEPVLATNLGRGNAPVEISIPLEVMAMTVIAAPLRFDEKTVELLYVVMDPEYGHSDWLALAALAVKHYQQAEMVWLNVGKIRQYAAVERELEKAQEIQMRLIPRQFNVPGLGLAVGFRPCYWVAGDYADVLPMADGRTLLAMADVCGKGLSAALIASSVHTMVHANVRAGKDLNAVMAELNQYLLEDLHGSSFVTMACISIDVKSGEFDIVNSGHPPAVIITREGDVRQLQLSENCPLGVDALCPIGRCDRLAPGELLALFTDGLTELMNPNEDMLGLEALSEGLRKIYVSEPTAPLGILAALVTDFLEDYQHGAMAADDRTFLLARLE